MRYTFHRWRARKTGSLEWRELGWCMTEEDAKIWAADNDHEVEQIAGVTVRESNAYGSPLSDAA